MLIWKRQPRCLPTSLHVDRRLPRITRTRTRSWFRETFQMISAIWSLLLGRRYFIKRESLIDRERSIDSLDCRRSLKRILIWWRRKRKRAATDHTHNKASGRIKGQSVLRPRSPISFVWPMQSTWKRVNLIIILSSVSWSLPSLSFRHTLLFPLLFFLTSAHLLTIFRHHGFSIYNESRSFSWIASEFVMNKEREIIQTCSTKTSGWWRTGEALRVSFCILYSA